MKAWKIYLVVNSILAILFGLAFLFVPQQFSSGYGLVLGSAGLVFARGIGSTLVGLGLIMWFVRGSKDPQTVRAICIGGIAVHVLNGGSDFMAMSGGIINSSAMGSVVMHVVLAAGFAYFLIKNPVKYS